MQKKVFSKENGTLNVSGNDIYLFEGTNVIASTNSLVGGYHRYLLPSTLIRKPKSDDELAELSYDNSTYYDEESYQTGFINGRKSVVGEYDLTREQVEHIYNAMVEEIALKELISSLTPLIYPTSIEVEYDGTTYLWETLKANYDN